MTSSNILVIEDRTDWQDILCTALAQQGLIPHSAMSYQDAVAALDSVDFRLAVVDPVLDKTNRFNRDGLSVIQKIKETQPTIPLIVLTGSLTHDMEITLQHLCPGVPILFKESWDPESFRETVEKLVGQPAMVQPQSLPKETPLAEMSHGELVPPPVEAAVGRPRVLLVENRKDWQDIVAAVLDEAGYFWRIAGNAQQALNQLELESFHLVILDLKLQQANLPLRSNEGWLLLDYLVERHPKTKVVILSGRAGPSDVADLLTQYPVIGFMEKQNFSPQSIKQAVSQASRSPQLWVQSFGQFQIWRDGHLIGLWDRPQAEIVTKLLLVRRARGERAVAADELITRLWPDADEESGRKKLLPLISNARRTLEPDIEPRDSHFILRSSNGYYFDLSEAVRWDLLSFREHYQQGTQLMRQEQRQEAIVEFEKGRKLYLGDFLAEDRYAEWAIDIRREITTEYCSLLIQLADAYAMEGQYDQAVSACHDALAKDPMQESVYRRLMRSYYCNGDKGQALKAYRNCLKLFEELFGESPTPKTRQLYEAISNDAEIDCLEVNDV